MATTPPIPPTAAGHADTAPLGDKLSRLLDISDALRGDVHGAEQARKKATKINLGLLAIVVLLVLAMLGITLQNRALTHRLDQTNARISDCTTPGGHCYDEGRARTGSAIQDIIRSEIFMAECSRLYPGEAGDVYDRKLEACVSQRLQGPGLRQAATAPPVGAPAPAPSRSGR